MLALPGLDEEERDGTGGMDGKSGDAGIDRVPPALPAVGITAVCPECTDPLDRCRETAEDLSNVASDIVRQVSPARREAQGVLDRAD